MVPSGPPPNQGGGVGGGQQVGPSLLRSNSAVLSAGQPVLSGAPLPPQGQFSSLLSPRTQFTANGSLGAAANVAALLNRPFANGGNIPMNVPPRGGMDSSGSDHLVGSATAADPLLFPSSPGLHAPLGQQSPNSVSNHMSEGQHFQQQLEAALDMQQQQQQHELLSMPQQTQLRPVKLENGRNMAAAVKLEPQGDQNGPGQMLRAAAAVKMEPQQVPVKMEMPPQPDPSLFMQQQQMLQLTKHNVQANSVAQLSLLQQQQQRLLQMQQQQQQLLKNLPLSRNPLQQQQQQLLIRQQSLPVRPQTKPLPYEPGTCAKRLTLYMFHQQNRPQDNNIEYWRSFVAEYYSPNAKKRWCVSLYGSGRQTTGVFPQDVWHCEICNRKPGRGFETTVEVLPRLFQIKYASGTLEELLYVDMPHETQNTSGQIVLDYVKAIQESVYEQLRVVREGHLRIVFNPDLKIASWEFCARRHEELVPRRSIIPQVSQLGAVVQKYQGALQNATAASTQDLQDGCNSFVACARQLAKALEVPLVNDLGYTKRYVRCLQIAEVVNCMKDLIDYSTQTNTGPKESLNNFPRRTAATGMSSIHGQHSEDPPPASINPNQNGQNAAGSTFTQLPHGGADHSASNSVAFVPSTSAPSSNVTGLLHGGVASSQEQRAYMATAEQFNSGNSNAAPHMTPSSSATSLPQMHSAPPASIPQAAQPSPNNSVLQSSLHANQMSSPGTGAQNMATRQQQQQPLPQASARPPEPDRSESQSSVQRILQEVVAGQLNSSGISNPNNDIKRANGMSPGINGVSCLVSNAIANNSVISGMGFGSMSGLGPSGLRAAMANSAMSMNGQLGMSPQDMSLMNHHQQQAPQQQQGQPQGVGNQLLNGLRSVNSFNNLPYDWKSMQ